MNTRHAMIAPFVALFLGSAAARASENSLPVDFSAHIESVVAEIASQSESARFRASRDKAYALDAEGGRLRLDLDALAQRARDRADRPGSFDPNFDTDLANLLRSLHGLASRTRALEAELKSLLAAAPRDGSLRPDAKGLEKSCFYLVARLNGLGQDAAFVREAFTRIGRDGEAADIERQTGAAERSARVAWAAVKAFIAELPAAS